MSDQIDNIKSMWQSAKESIQEQAIDSEQIIAKAKENKKRIVKMHYGNILILFATFIGLLAFFIYVARFNHLISHIGIGLMLGGLILRIIIELFSIYISGKVDLSETTMTTNNAVLKFYNFRKKIHGPVTITIIVLYTIGFYMLTPEFYLYFSRPILILIDISYLVGAVIFTFFIRKTIKNEMHKLNEIIRFQKDITQE